MYVNAKLIPSETMPRMEGGCIRENGGASEFKYI
jgi:hypothetical protein